MRPDDPPSPAPRRPAPGTPPRGAVLPPETVAVLTLLADGHTTDRIARHLDVSERTVRRRLRAAADELGADSTIETVVSAVRRGVI